MSFSSPPADSRTRADVLLAESLNLLAPLARGLVANGVTYPVFAQALKQVFLEAARAELTEQDKRITDSALSLLSGVHRKDVRTMSHQETAPQELRALSMAMEVATRWSSDPAFCDADGKPRVLSLRSKGSGGASFEELTQAVSKDFHSRSVLEEMLRLGVVKVDGDEVALRTDDFVPREGFAEAAYFLGVNGADHLAAALANLKVLGTGRETPFLEHAVFADELSADSAHELQLLARRLWVTAFKRFAQAAQDAVNRDAALPLEQRSERMRFGTYCFSTGMAQAPQAPAGTDEHESPTK